MVKAYYGSHISLSNVGSVINALKEIKEHNGNCIQIFLSSPLRAGKLVKISNDEIKSIRDYANHHDIKIFVHSPYTLNFAKEFVKGDWRIKAMIKEAILGKQIGAVGSVIHVGKQLSLSEDEALLNMEQYIREIIRNIPNGYKIIIETAAGQGSEVLTLLPELSAFIRRYTPMERKKIGLCIDTCHIYSAGYDITRKEQGKTFTKLLSKVFGIKNITLIHLNNSKTKVGSGVDRHEQLKKGTIHIDSLKEIIKFAKSKGIPLILETPDKGYKTEISLIKSV